MTAAGPPARDPTTVPASAIAAAAHRAGGAHDIWALAAHRTEPGRAARSAMIGVILDAAMPAIRQHEFRLDDTAEIRDTLAGALADAIAYRQPAGECADCERFGDCDDHAYDAALAASYAAVAAVLGLGGGT